MKSFKRAAYKQSLFNSEESIPCSGGISAEGQIGIYEVEVNIGTDLGYTGIQYNSYSIPDRFQIIYDGQVVADSKYVGSTSYFDDLPGTYNPKIFKYQAGEFIDTGDTEEVIVTSSDAANGSPSQPTSGRGIIQFNRTNYNSTKMTIRVTGVLQSTLWTIQSRCPQEDPINFVNTFQLDYAGSPSNINCTNPNTNLPTFYSNDSNLTVGSVLYTDTQRTQKARSGYYLQGTIIYNFDGNTIVDTYPCNIKDIAL